MKFKALRPLIVGISFVTFSALILYVSQKKDTSNKKDELVSLRKKHAEFLENSPFKETLKLSRKERKAIGLPPNRFFEQMQELTINPNDGKLHDDNIFIVQEELKQKRSFAKRVSGDDANNPWIERGPNDVGGRTRAIMFDPNDSNNRRVFAGGVSGGLWVNNDITSSTSQWSRIQNVPGNLSVTSITVDPRNSNTWYVGTGEQYTAGAVVGNGVYRSTNGGASWSAVNIPAAGAATFNFSDTNLFLSGLFYVNDIVAWNNTAQNRTELFVGVGAHVYGDAKSPSNWLGLQTAGLYRSIDGGATWNRIESSNLAFDFRGTNYYMIPNDIEIGADNTLWMGTITTPGIGGDGGGRVFSSTNGASWTEAAASPLADSNRVEIEVSSTNPNKIYALTQGITSPVHIYKTTNKFGNVTETALPKDADAGIPDNDFTRGQSFYDLMIEADPTNDDILYVGGIDLFRSSNGGSSWRQISRWSTNSGLANLPVSTVHADQHAMTFRPGNSNQAIFGNDGGVFYASNLAQASSSRVFGARNNNYNVTQYVKAGIGPNGRGDTAGIFTAGAQDNGSQAFRNTGAGINGSEELTGGDGFYTFVDKDGQYMLATYTNNVIYRFSLPWNGRSRIQGGATTILDERNTGDFVNQMGYDSDANFLLSNASSGTDFSIKTIDVANNRKGNITNAMLTAKPTAFIPSSFNNNTWYVGTADGKLIKLSGVGVGSGSWTAITTPFVGSVSSVRLGATANDIMVSIHNYGVTSVWFSSDAGATWANKEGNLPDIPVRDILQNPLERKEVILATQLGVWVTKNFDATNPTWEQAYNGMSDASVTSFDYWKKNASGTNNIIIASTYGRGVFTGTFTSNSTTTEGDSNGDTQSTACTSGVSSFPYNEGFENTLGQWTQATNDDLNWTVDASGTPSGNTGPASATQGSYYIFVEASGDGTGFPNKQAILTSPCFDLTGLTAANFSFSYHMYGANDMGTIAVEASMDNGATWTSLWNESGNKGNSWNNATIDLSGYAGGSVKLRFNRVTGGTWQADIAIDNVSLTAGGGIITSAPVDICDGVAPYDRNNSYVAGDRVTFQGSLYENKGSSWENLGPCGTVTASVAGATQPSYQDLNDVASVSNETIAAAFTVYPNPVHEQGTLFVAGSTIGKDAYTIINGLGQIIDQGYVETSIDVSQFHDGVYTIMINGQTQRFIKR